MRVHVMNIQKRNRTCNKIVQNEFIWILCVCVSGMCIDTLMRVARRTRDQQRQAALNYLKLSPSLMYERHNETKRNKKKRHPKI